MKIEDLKEPAVQVFNLQSSSIRLWGKRATYESSRTTHRGRKSCRRSDTREMVPRARRRNQAAEGFVLLEVFELRALRHQAQGRTAELRGEAAGRPGAEARD